MPAETEPRSFSRWLMEVDRRWLFLAVFVIVVIVLILGIEIDIGVTAPTVEYFTAIDRLQPGSTILVSMDLDPSTLPELEPMLSATVKHAFERGIRVIGMVMLMEGVSIGERVMRESMDEINAELADTDQERRIRMGEDWVYLGYRAGNEAVLLGIGSEIRGVFSQDFYGYALDEHPMMRTVHNYDDMDLISTISGTNWPEFWVAFAGTPCHIPVIVGCTAVSAPQYYAFLQTNQMAGLLGGLKGAAEYERLIDRRGLATNGIAAQLVVHLFLVGLIVLGNAAYFIDLWRKKRRGR